MFGTEYETENSVRYRELGHFSLILKHCNNLKYVDTHFHIIHVSIQNENYKELPIYQADVPLIHSLGKSSNELILLASEVRNSVMANLNYADTHFQIHACIKSNKN